MFTTLLMYIVISAALTIGVGYTLHRNGRVFLVEAFNQNMLLADSTNHLLLVGFYLINLGYIMLTVTGGTAAYDATAQLVFLCGKIGMAVIVLGVMHFFNMFVILRLGKRLSSLVPTGSDLGARPVA